MIEPVTAEQARAWLEERAARAMVNERAVSTCGACEVVAFTEVERPGLWRDDSRPPQGWIHMQTYAGYVKPCAAHAPTQRYAWLRDVPAQAAADFLNKGEAFLIDSMRALLPPEHPEHAA